MIKITIHAEGMKVLDGFDKKNTNLGEVLSFNPKDLSILFTPTAHVLGKTGYFSNLSRNASIIKSLGATVVQLADQSL